MLATIHSGNPDLIDAEPRPDDNRAVQFLNGPGQNAAGIRNSTTVELTAGDVFVIPAGTGHQFTKIDDHITYLMVRIDPNKIVSLLDKVGSEAYLLENAPQGCRCYKESLLTLTLVKNMV